LDTILDTMAKIKRCLRLQVIEIVENHSGGGLVAFQ